ncbi:hypothetical protein [Tumebacillus flagellatus]|uniref:Uncharacterized protein n=1 Tax=Tumebacillus flagellatus TaxID=1157490 RepID=A0A074M672_9BACL|nr:hypothetical protein [Tumebacillus flagellatus]KEO81502.1 hypothetical protein EL26_20735 [Tumebacillus flagellatus]
MLQGTEGKRAHVHLPGDTCFMLPVEVSEQVSSFVTAGAQNNKGHAFLTLTDADTNRTFTLNLNQIIYVEWVDG